MARNVVATSQPLAAQAGLQALVKGGNAVDAALTVAITLTVVEPVMNGIGGDLFAIVWDGEAMHGLNSSGHAPAAWTPERFAQYDEMPETGWDCVTIPGGVAGWTLLSEKFGRLGFSELFEPAINYARNGYAVSPITANRWFDAEEKFRGFKEFGDTFFMNGRAPRAGEKIVLPHHGNTLELIANTRGDAFYRGELAESIVHHAEHAGGAITLEDLSAHRSEWVECIDFEYHGVRVHEIPPNGQGIASLIALGVLQELDIAQYPVDSCDSLHLQIEAMKVGVAAAHQYVADPAHMTVNVVELLDAGFLTEQASRIRLDRALRPDVKVRREHGTVYLTTADASGMMVSLIQSNYHGFGSGIVIPERGISMHNRGSGFSLQAGHPNQVGGGKRPFHTIIPAFVTRNERPLMSFGVMGAHMQPQGHVQMIVRIIDYGQNPQAASDAPRWHVHPDFKLTLEAGFPQEFRTQLTQRGHEFEDQFGPGLFGGAQLIYCLEDGYCAASDHRKDGLAVGY